MQWIRQRMRPHVFGKIFLPEETRLENGSVETRLVDQASFKLPSSDTTKLSSLIAAGVDVKRVDSAVYGFGNDSPATIVIGDGDKPEEIKSTEGE